MINTRFEAFKVRSELKRCGVMYEFKRFKENDFGEPDKGTEPGVLGNIEGIYHEQNSNIQIMTGDTTQIRTKKIPMILCLYDDVALLTLKIGDIVSINTKTFKVTGIVNIQEWNIIADISLEVIDDGTKAEL